MSAWLADDGRAVAKGAGVLTINVGGQCAFCKNKVAEGRYLHTHAMAACEYGQPWFPHATKCVRYEPEDMDE